MQRENIKLNTCFLVHYYRNSFCYAPHENVLAHQLTNLVEVTTATHSSFSRSLLVATTTPSASVWIWRITSTTSISIVPIGAITHLVVLITTDEASSNLTVRREWWIFTGLLDRLHESVHAAVGDTWTALRDVPGIQALETGDVWVEVGVVAVLKVPGSRAHP